MKPIMDLARAAGSIGGHFSRKDLGSFGGDTGGDRFRFGVKNYRNH
jgi:hypothetical protein